MTNSIIGESDYIIAKNLEPRTDLYNENKESIPKLDIPILESFKLSDELYSSIQDKNLSNQIFDDFEKKSKIKEYICYHDKLFLLNSTTCIIYINMEFNGQL